MAVFAEDGPMRILVESGTESEWVAQTLEAAGHEVIVADPNFAPMYGEIRRKVKTDRRDVAALAEANRRGWYRRGVSGVGGRSGRSARCCAVAGSWCRCGSGTISLMRALLRQGGLSRWAPAVVSAFRTRLARLTLPPALTRDDGAAAPDGGNADDGDSDARCAPDAGRGGRPDGRAARRRCRAWARSSR